MIRSTELKDLILRLYAALSDETISSPVQDLFSKEEGFIAIGTDQNEWWEDAGIIIQSYQARAKAGGSKVLVNKIEAFQEGTTGWVVDRVVLITPEGDEIPVRHTYVFHQVDGKWKIVHAHYSLDVNNVKF